MLPASARRLICGSHRCGKTTLLAEAAASYLHNGSDSGRLVALSAHRHAGRTLRAALHEQTGQELPAADVRRRATALLEQFPAAAGLPAGWSRTEIVSALDRRVLMRRAWAAVAATDSLYAKYSARPGSLDWLAGIFDLFAEWSGTADPDLLAGPAPRDSVLVELWSAYRHYLGLCRQLQLVAFQEVVPRALDVLRHKDVHARAVPDLLLLDDLDLFRPSELLFVQALIEPATAVVASAAMAPSARSPDPHVRFLDRWCAALSLRQEHPASAESPCVPLFNYAECRSPEHEADMIAREIVNSFGPDSRFADYAIICFDPELIPVLRRTLPQWSIAVEGMDARDAFLPAIAPLLHLGMRLIAGTPTTAAELAGYLRHPGVGLQTGDAHMLAAESGVGTTIPADPIVLLEEQARACSTAAGRQRLRQIVDVTFMLRATEWSPSLKLQRWLEVLDCAAVTTAFVAAGAEQWELRADADLVERWLGFLGRSERLRTALGEPLSDPDAVDVLVGSQALVEPLARPLADAVRIWQPDQLGGCSAPTVWLAGLHEHTLPQRSAALAWVPPETFAELGWLPGFVPPMKDDRAARWDQGLRSLERATGRATRRLGFSWSQTDARGHRRLRSPLLGPFMEKLAAPAAEAPSHSLPRQSGLAVRPMHVESLLTCDGDPVTYMAERLHDPFTTSPSALEDFLTCPRRYFYARVLNLYDVVASSRQTLGQVVHAALHDLKEGGDALLSPALLVEQHWPAGGGLFGTRLREEAFRRLAVQAVGQIASFDAQYATSEYVAGEAAFSWQIAPDVELRGKVDRIDRGADGLVVIDYKLGNTSPSVAALLGTFAPPDEADLATWRPSDLQLPLYALAIEQGMVPGADIAPGERVTAIGLVYPLQLYTARGKTAAAGRRMIRIVDHVTGCGACEQPDGAKHAQGILCRNQLDRIAARALLAIDDMRSGSISPDPIEGPRTCAGCAFRAICPAPQA